VSDARQIPVFEPVITESDIEAVTAAVRLGEISGSFSPSIEQFEQEFAAYVGCKFGIAVTSGTTALHLAVRAADVKPGAELLVSSSTNIATGLACLHNDLRPVGVDSEATTWNLDLDQLESVASDATRGIIPVHLFGHPVDMPKLMAIAERKGWVVIEDCAESHGATAYGRMTGSFGHMGCFSFYANKLITSGEGGMITTNDVHLAERCRLLRNLAFQKPRFFHEEAGYNFRMTGMQGALGLSQFRRIHETIAQKRALARMYNERLAGIGWIQTPAELEWARNVYWMYAIVLRPDAPVSRDALVQGLGERGVDTRTFFCPMNDQPCLREQAGFREVPAPVAGMLWRQGLYLPSTQTLTEDDVAYVVDAIKDVARGVSR